MSDDQESKKEKESHPAQRAPIGDTEATADVKARESGRREVHPGAQTEHEGGY